MRNHFLSTLSKVALIGGLALSTQAFGAVKIRMGHVLNTSHSWHVAADNFAKDVKEATDGRVEITLFPSSQLGDEKEMIEALQFGAMGGGVIGSGSFQSIEPTLGITNLPYAWATREDAFTDLDGALGNQLAKNLEKHGIVTLAWYEGGYRHVSNNKHPVYTPADLKGLKLRVTPDKVRLETFKALGAEPAPLAFGELYSALQQGLFDGQENPVNFILNQSFYEVQKYLSLTSHVWSSAALVMAKSTWDKISIDDQASIRKLAKKWETLQRQQVVEQEGSVTEQLEAKGLKINAVDDLKPFQEAVKPVWNDFEKQHGTGLLDLMSKRR